MSVDDLLIVVTYFDMDVHIGTFRPALDDDIADPESMHFQADRLWVREDHDIYSVADWVYYDPMDWGQNKAVEMYGTARANGYEDKSLLEWTSESEMIQALHEEVEMRWAIRYADDYEQAIKQLENIK